MKKAEEEEMLPFYDFRGARRGFYAKRYHRGLNVIVLDDDVAAAFRSQKAVNDVLRALIPYHLTAGPLARLLAAAMAGRHARKPRQVRQRKSS